MHDDYKGEAILEAIEETRQLNAWCSHCETHAEDCTCGRNDYLSGGYAPSDHSSDADKPEAQAADSAPLNFSCDRNDYIEDEPLSTGGGDTPIQSECANTSLAAGETPAVFDPLENQNNEPEGFAEWLDAHNDRLPVPEDFEEYLKQTGDSI